MVDLFLMRWMDTIKAVVVASPLIAKVVLPRDCIKY